MNKVVILVATLLCFMGQTVHAQDADHVWLTPGGAASPAPTRITAMMKRLAVFAFTLVPMFAFAQVQRVTGLNASGTIAVTGTYQTLQQASIDRRGCTIQNNGTHAMSVEIGASIWAVPAGQWISCNNAGIVLTDAVSITGTAGDAFTASFQ